MELLKKYWWCFILALIIVPIILNFVLLIPAFTDIVGDNSTWLNFFGSLIGALASFAMIFFTAKTLEQNKQQLDELKRQWEEEHSPSLSCQLITHNSLFVVQVINTSKVPAFNVKIDMESHIKRGMPYFDKMQEYLKKNTFTIPPFESLYFDINITPYKEIEQLPEGYIAVSLYLEKNKEGIFNLYPQHFAYSTAKI